jgi:hypothetical protein
MMYDTLDRPLLFLDVDGPLVTFRLRPEGLDHSPGCSVIEPSAAAADPLLNRFNPDDGRRLLGLGCRLVWATTWMAEANEVISPLIGLPQLPVVDWPDTDEEPRHGLYWKTEYLVRWAAGKPFVWLDDEIRDVDRRWVSGHHSGRALLYRVDPYVGLTDADFSSIHQWLAK